MLYLQPKITIMVAEAISGAVGIGSAIYGGIKAGQERKKMAKYLSGQEADNAAWYNANALSDYTQRADTQALMKNTRDALKKNNEVATNSAVVTGATPESVAVAKEQSNKVITDTMSRVGATGQQWKDGITDKYMARKNQLSGLKYGEMEGAEQSYESLMGNGIKQIGSAAGSTAGGLLDPVSTTGVDVAAIATPKTGVAVAGGFDPTKVSMSKFVS